MELPERIRVLMGQAWAPVRVLTAASQAHGPDVLEPLYTALGIRFHQRQQPRTRPTVEAALRDVGLPADLADAGYTDAYDEVLRASHQKGIALVGEDVGPCRHRSTGLATDADQVAFFGPVVTPAPKGEEAGHGGRNPDRRLHTGLLRDEAQPHRRSCLRLTRLAHRWAGSAPGALLPVPSRPAIVVTLLT